MDIYKLLSRLPLKRFKEPPPTVAVVRLAGVIGSLGPLRSGLTLADLSSRIERAFKLPRLKAVALEINSPGGSPVQSALIARRIRALADQHEIPVLAFAEDVAASGGYWLATAGDEIYADDSSIVGSIGVISAGFGFQGLIERFGVERRLHTSGDKKALLDPFKPEDPDEVARLKAVQVEIHEHFKAHVRARRGERLTADDETLFSGEFWTGGRALELGLIDGLGDLNQVLRERYGDKVNVKRLEPKRPWWKKTLGASAAEGWSAGWSANWADSLLASLQERAHWSRFGL